MLDEFTYTSSVRNSPEYKDVPILNILEKKQYPGGAANVALNIKKLKAIPYLVGVIGEDDASKVMHELLHREDITNLYIHTNPRQKTIRKTRIFQDRKPVFRIDEEAPSEYEPLQNHFVLKHITDAINNHKPHAIILQDYNKGVLNAAVIPEILTIAKQHNLLICVDPKFENWNSYKDVDLFKPNLQEFDFMCQQESEGASENQMLLKRAVDLKEKINFKNLLVTLGAKGNFSFDGNKSQISNLKSQIQQPDVCGAGDAVIAVASLAMVCGFPLEETADLANKAGFMVCRKENVQPVTLEELSLSY